jgi:hypothetical protein
MDALLLFGKITIAAVAFKAIVGFHFPWEKCECCGHKWGHHKKTSGIIKGVRKEFEDDESEVVDILTNDSLISLHIDKCVDFDPQLGDLVEINDIDWTLRKIWK